MSVFGFPIAQLVKFGLVGGVATFVHAGVGYSSATLFDLNGQQANVIGFCFAWGISFFGHHTFTFERRANQKAALLRFVVHSLALFFIASTITAALTSIVTSIDDSFVPVLAAFFVPALSFISSKFFVFRSA